MRLTDGSTSGSDTLQVGWEFTAQWDATAVAARVLGGGTHAETVRLWRISDEALLASAELTTANLAWVEQPFSSPVSLSQGESYAVTIFPTAGSGSRTTRSISSVLNDVGFSRRVTFVRGRRSTTGSAAFPTSTTADIMFAVTDLLLAGDEPPMPNPVVRSGSDTVGAFGADCYQEFIPVQDVTLAGATLRLQATSQDLNFNVWESGVTGAAIASQAGVVKAGGVYAATLGTPVVLAQGRSYRVGWVRTAGGELSLVQSGSSWEGFMPRSGIFYASGSGYPSTAFGNRSLPHDLVLA